MFFYYVVMKLDLIDSESKETDDKRNQHGSQGKSQSSRGIEVVQTHRAPQTGGEGKEDGGDGDGEDEKRRKKPIPPDAISIEEQAEEGEEEDGGKITYQTTQIIMSNYSR